MRSAVSSILMGTVSDLTKSLSLSFSGSLADALQIPLSFPAPSRQARTQEDAGPKRAERPSGDEEVRYESGCLALLLQ